MRKTMILILAMVLLAFALPAQASNPILDFGVVAPASPAYIF